MLRQLTLALVAASSLVSAVPFAAEQRAFTSTTSSASAASSTSSAVSTVTVDGKTFLNYGLVAFGRIPHTALDSYGESLGGLGSAAFLESFNSNKDGSYSGSIRLQPDRGHNQGGEATSDYRARSHLFDLSFTPLDKKASVPSPENLKLTYKSSLLYRYKTNFTTGLDPDISIAKKGSFPQLPAASFDDHVSIDSEGLVVLGDLILTSDEYGPNIYAIEKSTGLIIGAIAPPEAIVPKIDGKTNFTALVNPDSGRAANQGFEGLTFDKKTGTLWALLQTATAQDGGNSDTTNTNTRLLGWSGVSLTGGFKPVLKYEYVVTLPASKKGKARGASEVHSVGDGVLLVLTRDGDGFGDDSSESSFKQVALITTTGATNIANTQYDSPTNPVSPGGKLVSGITPIKVSNFVDLIDDDQLAKFGLHNGGDFDSNLIASKLESIALASDSKNKGEQFLFVVSDNDFITTQGKQAGQVDGKGEYVLSGYSDPYAEEYGSQDTQAFVYKVKLPGYNGS